MTDKNESSNIHKGIFSKNPEEMENFLNVSVDSLPDLKPYKDGIKENISRIGSVSLIAPKEISESELNKFMEIRTPFHKAVFDNEKELDAIKIYEEQKTKRLSMVLSVILTLSAILIVIFAPAEKQVLSYWLGGALLTTVAGISGFSRIVVKSETTEMKVEK